MSELRAVNFWPYRPRQGMPSVPAWLLLVLIVLAAIALITLGTLLGGWAPKQ